MSTATVRTDVDTGSTAGDGLLELTGAQLGIWNAQRLEPDSPYYVVGDVLQISGDTPVDVPALVEAVRATAGEAETLRLRLVTTPDGPRQYVDPGPVPPPPVVDLRDAPDPHAAARDLVAAERARIAADCRDMTGRSLFRPSVAVLGDTEVHYLQLGHHLVFDGYSATQLCRRIGARYTAAVRGEEPPRCPFRPFADLVAADLEYRAGEQAGQDRAFWRDLLTPLPEAPGGPPPPDGPAAATVTAHRELGPDTIARLKEVADGAGVTWGELVIAGYAAFLHRLESRTDVVFALPLMCRAGSAALRTPAMMVNVLPLRLTVRPGDRLDELGRRTAAALRDVRAHQRFRGEDLPRELPGSGELLHGRGINLKASFDFGVRLGEATGVLVNVAGGPPEDLGLTATPTATGGLLLGFEADARTNDEPVLRRRLDALADLLTALAGPGLPPVGAVRLLAPDERDRALAALDRPAPAGTPKDLPELLDDLAADPDRPALVHAGVRLTAGELVGRVRELSAALRGRGLGPGDVVAVSLPREPALVVALLAVLDAGAAFLVLDPAHPPQRRRDLLDDARPALLLATPETLADLPAPACAVLDPAGPLPAEPAASGPLDPDRPAYVLYTSGSTGRPKGVLARAGGLAALVHHHRGTLVAEAERAAGRGLRAAHTYSFAFDAALDQLTWLLTGHELHLYGTDLVRDGEALAAALRADRIDVVDTTPSLAGPLLDAGLLDGDHRPVLLVLGGEATPAPLWRRVAASGVTAYNLYGPTEATVDATLAPVTGEHPTIGLPLAGTRGLLLDAALAPVAVGEPGELYLAGPHLALGYLDRPGTTAERFVANPFGPGRMYRTGDRARLTDAGLEFLGRDDGQVKIRGYRVELGEVEAELAAVPGVGAAAVTVRADAGRDRLVGYVTGDLTPDAVRDALAARLPEHLVPSAVLVLDALPTTVNGKLDRAALPAPAPSAASRAPATDAERSLHDVVAGVLGADRIDVDDDFLALGGDSISAIAVGSRLREAGLELRPRDLLARRSLAALAAMSGTAAPAAAGRDVVPDEPAGPVPAPPIVRGLLDPNRDPASIAGYAQWTALRIDVPARTPDLAAAVGAVLDRHDALRLRCVDGEPVVLPAGAVDTARAFREAATGPLTDDRVADLAGLLAGELDPAAADLVRVLLARTGEGTPDRLLVVVHHLAADGVSWRVLLPDLHRAWTAAARGEDPALPRTGASWRRHAGVLAEQGGSGARRDELPYWRSAAAATVRIGDRPLDPRYDTVATARHDRTVLDAGQTSALVERLPAAYRAGVDEVLLAAVALTLRTVTGATDAATVGTEGHGRESAGLDLAGTVGWFTVEHPVRLPLGEVAGPDALREALAGGPAAGRLLRAVKEAARAVPGDGSGHGVLRWLDPRTRAELGADAPPDVLVNYLGRFAASPGAGWRMPEGSAFAVTEPPGKALEQLLALNCFLTGGAGGERLSVEWTAAGAALGPDRVAEVQRAFAAAVAGLAAHAAGLGTGDGGLTPSDLPLVALDQATIDELQQERPVADVLPATALQAGLSFHSMALADGDTDVYVVQAVVTLAGDLDPDRMRAAAAELLRRHPSLRIHLAALDDGRVVQVVPAGADLDWRFADLTRDGDPAGAFAGVAAAEQARPFDPARPPLIRFLLARLGPGDHRLAITNHHALLDGWSMPLVGKALLAIHDELGGGPAVPPPPPVADHFAWLAARDHDAGRRAWRELLDGVDESTRIAPGATGTTVARPERRSVALGAEFSASLRRFARERGVTLTAVLHTAWGIVLGRATGRRDVLFGQPVSGRPAEVPGVERMVGQLGNTVPVRVRWAPGDTAAAVLGAVHDRSVAMSEHHHVGLPDVQRDAGAGDLFDTMLVMENFPAAERRPAAGPGPGPVLAGVEIADATHYPLTVVVIPDDEIVIGLGYQPAALSGGAVRALGHALHTVLHELVADPERPATALPLLDPADRAEALRVADGGPGATFTLAERFAGWVASRPDHPAVQCRDRVLTYAELDARADALARELVRRGVRPEQPVAVLLDRDVEMPLAIIGILRAGAVYLPLDPAYPQARLETMVSDAAPVAALTVGATTGTDADRLLAGRGVPRIRLDEVLAGGDGPPLPTYDPDRLAYVIFTSGTTGRPKPVGVPHRGLADLVLLSEGTFGATADDRVLQFASTSFDVAFFQTTIALASGGTSVVAPAEVRDSADALLDHIAAQRVTLANLLPSFLAAMPDDRTLPPDITLLVGAERLDPALARRWGARRGLVNCYGPTEVSINAVAWAYDPDDPGPLPIGVPDPGIRAYVLDGGLQPVGPDRTGELYLAGAGLARGYLGRPGATASSFVANPFGAPGERMYRTGDLVHLRADGRIAFLGRADDQVKIRGFRIELGEIETVLGSQDGVRAATVIVRDDRLVGYVVPAGGAAPAVGALRAALAAELPAHMVPTHLVPLDRLPLTPAGKLDRDALPAPDRVPAGPSREHATEAERILLGVLRDVLADDTIGPDDDFLAAGGDSIVSLQVISRARRAGRLLTARDVFDGGTAAGMAIRSVPAADAPADAGPVTGDAPLTPVMRDLLRRGGSGRPGDPSAGYCQWTETVVPAGGDVTLWHAVLDALLERHDALRAHLAVPDTGGEPVLRVPGPGAVTGADVLVRTALAPGDDARAVADRRIAAARDGLDPYRGPLLRAEWLDGGPDRPGRLVLLAHHLVVDPVSWRVLLDDLAQAHRAVVAGATPALPPVGRTWVGWALALHAATDARRAELPHWRAVTAAADPGWGEVALDPARDTAATARHHEIRLDPATTTVVLTTLPVAHGTGPDAVLLTALARAAHRWRGRTGEPELLVDLQGHGRPTTGPDGSGPLDLSRTVGWFTTVTPALVRPGTGGPAAVGAQLRAAGDGLGHGLLRDAPDRPLGDAVRPRVTVNYLGRFTAPTGADEPWRAPADAGPLGSGDPDAMPFPHELAVNALATADGGDGAPTLAVRFTWPEALFGADRIAALAGLLRDELVALAGEGTAG